VWLAALLVGTFAWTKLAPRCPLSLGLLLLLLQEGHHLHTVGLELQLDVSAPDPGQWAPGQAWLAGSLWPSPQALAAAWNSSRANNSSSSGDVPGGADAAALELLSSFHLPSPSERQLLLRTVRVLGRQAVLV
jgi:hypothetical protein